MRTLRWIAALAAVLLPVQALADSPSFSNITAADFDKIVRELSANFSYSTVTPASSLGGLWGFELGVIGGITKTPEILGLVKRTGNTSFKEDKFPHGGALARIGAPYGLTAELLAFPKMTISDVGLSQWGGSAMWTVTDVFFTDWPVTVAVKGYLSKTSLDFTQNNIPTSVSGVTATGTIDYDNTIMGAQLLVSKKFLVFEPYLGLGFASAKGELAVVGAPSNATIFSSAFTSSQRADSSPSSAVLLAGLDIRLLFFSLGGEYQKSFETDSLTGRVSFRF